MFRGEGAVTGSSRDTAMLESLVTRLDALVGSISDREKIVSTTKIQIDQFQQRTEDLLEQKVAALEAKINNTMSDQLNSTVGYTKELYARFERMIWIAMVLLAGVSAFIGYQTFTSIPEKISSEIAKIATVHAKELEATIEANKKTSEAFFSAALISHKTRIEQMQKNEESLAAKQKQFDESLANIVRESNKAAAAKVEQVATTYDTHFHNFQIDVWIQTLQRPTNSTADAEMIRQLVQEFDGLDATRQSNAATVLAGRSREIPSNMVTQFKSSLEKWKPGENAASVSARYQLLVRYRSDAVNGEILGKIKQAISNRNEDQVVEFVRYIWQSFGGASSFGSIGSDEGMLGRRISDASQIFADCLPILRAALESTAGPRTLPMVLDIRYIVNVRNSDLDSSIAKALPTAADDTRTMSAFFQAMSRFAQDAQLFKASVDYATRTSEGINRLTDRVQSRVPGILLAYALENSAAIRNDDKLAASITDLLSNLRGDENLDGLDKKDITNYLSSGNIFVGGIKQPLTNDKVLKQISWIQDKDFSWTPITDFEKKDISLGSGLQAKVLKLSIDGSDTSDEVLGVEIGVEVGGQPYTLKFSGREIFSIQSRLKDHLVESGGRRIRFGIEMRNRQISLMIGDLG
jgi:hypothetical protein